MVGKGRRWRAVRRASVAAWILVIFWTAIAAMGASDLHARGLDWLASLAILGSLALLIRTARIGLYSNSSRALRCVHWFYTRTYRADQVRAVRILAYSGVANRFSDSALLGMLAVELVSGRVVSVRSTVAPAPTLARAVSAWERGTPTS